MTGPLEYCPNCGGTRSTTISLGTIRGMQPDGREGVCLMYHLHCSSCNTYIMSIPCMNERQPAHGIAIPDYLEAVR